MTDYSQRTITELAAALHMRRRQLQPSRPKPGKTHAEVEAEVRRFVDMMRDGMNSREAAAIIGVAYHTMRQRLYDRGHMVTDFQ